MLNTTVMEHPTWYRHNIFDISLFHDFPSQWTERELYFAENFAIFFEFSIPCVIV